MSEMFAGNVRMVQDNKEITPNFFFIFPHIQLIFVDLCYLFVILTCDIYLLRNQQCDPMGHTPVISGSKFQFTHNCEKRRKLQNLSVRGDFKFTKG